MPNINKIKLSGTSYDIQDANATKTVELTQAQYDALVTGGTVDSNTFYIITDGEMFNPSGKVDTSAFTEFSGSVETALSGKQDTLIAGDNITISGNVISASGGGSITIDSGITSGSTNAVENGAIWSATTYNKEVTLDFDNSSLSQIHYSTNFPSGCTTVKVTVPIGGGYINVSFHSGNIVVGSATINNYGTPSVSMNFTDASYTIENNDVIITYPASKSVNKVGAENYLQGAIVKAVVEGAFVNENTYMSVEVDGKIKALDDKKLDATAYTPTVVDSQLNAASTNPVQNQALYDELVIEGAETEATLTFTGTYYNYQSTNYPSGCTKVKISNVPTNNYDAIIFYDSSNNELGRANITNYGTPSVSLTFNGASYSIVDGVVIIIYPTVSNVSYIRKTQDATTVKAVETQTTHLIDQVTANTTSIATKQDILSAGTGIDITDNVISVTGGGGGKAISAGTNISVTTGETADTINCTVPASASSGNYSIMFGQPTSSGDASGSKTITGGQWSKAFSEGAVSIGQMNEARGQWAWAIGNNTRTYEKASFACGDFTSAKARYAFSEGTNTTANTQASHAAGSYTSTKNRSEFSIGEYNNSVSASTTFGDSGNTLFSVGNGTANNARHNAFEIRQNGDIYLTSGGTDIKLQDQLGGGGSSYSAGTGIDITNDVISVTGMTAESAFTAHTADTTIHVTSSDKTSWNGAATNASNAVTALGGLSLVKLTQAEYDALATKDSNTLYVIVN